MFVLVQCPGTFWSLLPPKKMNSHSFPTVLVHGQCHVVLGIKMGQLVLARANLGAEIPLHIEKHLLYPESVCFSTWDSPLLI